MTQYTKTTPGAPRGGFYTLGDEVTDSNGVIWQAVRTGYVPSVGVVESPLFATMPVDLSIAGASNQGTLASVTGLTLQRFGSQGPVRHLRFTLADVPQTVVNGTEYQGTQLFTFPEGRIYVLGTVATLAQKTTSVLADTLNASSTGSVALGTATASATTLASTMVDLAPATAFTSSATISVAGTAVSPVLTAVAFFDGTSTAKAMFLNSAFATTTDVDADATITWTGTIDIVYVLIGDK